MLNWYFTKAGKFAYAEKIVEDELRLKKMHFAHAITPLENPMSIRALRKDISRLKTEIKKRTLA